MVYLEVQGLSEARSNRSESGKKINRRVGAPRTANIPIVCFLAKSRASNVTAHNKKLEFNAICKLSSSVYFFFFFINNYIEDTYLLHDYYSKPYNVLP